ncbi:MULTISPECIES: histidine phosphatase family protein [Actinosynnema]|uniref:histidine phosphatase family protein n=1 Tax=Actinosynnema TaxID=40566 RepID=UPI0020A5136B|nr:histidine phosphatase family protein [Actinosynnema pretiosum]MCP2096258.1 putative phosphomutase, MSMEG_4193 family [Actinosynnema pretiosum]
MATVILLRHARSTANGSAILAGRQPGVRLAEDGERQARALVDRLAGVRLDAVVTSPLERCGQTLEPLLAERGLTAAVEPELAEVEYGEWTGRPIKELLQEPLWKVVQQHPSAAVFPGGEGLARVQARAVAAVRAHDARITEEFGPGAVWLACSHGDVIKSLLADALGAHLDGFQRIVVDPASLSVVRYTETRPFVLRVNDNGGDLAGVVPPVEKPASSDAVVGGTTGA